MSLVFFNLPITTSWYWPEEHRTIPVLDVESGQEKSARKNANCETTTKRICVELSEDVERTAKGWMANF